MRLGAAVRHEWDLDPGFLTVNHGSFGAAPRVVLAAQAEWRRRMEAQPTRFMARELPAALDEARARLAAFIGADAADVAFVANATEGCNAVLRSFRFAPGDEILVLDHGYGAVTKTVRYVAERAGARAVTAALPFPHVTDDAILAAVAASLTPATRLAVLDHVTSPSAIVLPLARIAALCRAAGVAVLADGAHGPGNLDPDVPALGADWYVGNCHKWLCAPKGCAFLWVQPARQAGLHPVTISHGFGEGWLAAFDWTGTRDPSAWLALPAALAFHERLGGARLRARNRALAMQGAALVAQRLGGALVTGDTARCAMAVIGLPGGPTQAAAMRARLLDRGTDAPVHRIDNTNWLRLSAAAYNEPDDYRRLADLLAAEAAERRG